ncbi:hypothetical protein ACFVYP_34335 [Kitasatospora sp. NPDC058201]
MEPSRGRRDMAALERKVRSAGRPWTVGAAEPGDRPDPAAD